MVLKIPVRKPAVPVAPPVRHGVRQHNSAAFAQQQAKPAIIEAPAERETGDPKTVSCRLPPSHFAILEDIKRIAECDKSEAIKKSLRLMGNALNSHGAVLLLTDINGDETTIPIMVRGRPA